MNVLQAGSITEGKNKLMYTLRLWEPLILHIFTFITWENYRGSLGGILTSLWHPELVSCSSGYIWLCNEACLMVLDVCRLPVMHDHRSISRDGCNNAEGPCLLSRDADTPFIWRHLLGVGGGDRTGFLLFAAALLFRLPQSIRRWYFPNGILSNIKNLGDFI